MTREPFGTSVPYADLDTTPLRELPAAAWSPELFFADELLDAVVDRWCLRTRAAISDESTIADDRRYAWEWVNARLEQARLSDPRWSDAALDDAVESVRADLGATFDLVDTVGECYPAFLRGEVDGTSILLTREALPLWERYFDNGNLSYAAINRIAAATAAAAVGGDSVHALEVGGGFGSAADALIDALGDRVGEYRFTEKAPFFLAKGKLRLRRAHEGVPFEFGRVDIEQSLVDQGVPSQSFDLVFGVNVLHAVHDLGAALAQLRDALRPGGAIVLGEAVRPRRGFLVPIEFVFQVTREFREVRLDPSYRPAPGFLAAEDWPRALSAAGFENPRVVPDFARVAAVYPTYSLGAVVAHKPK